MANRLVHHVMERTYWERCLVVVGMAPTKAQCSINARLKFLA
jgi:hypothetical protein